MRTIVYVDGLNLYYTLLKGTNYRWLDLEKLLVSFFGKQNDIVAIKYFTATVLIYPPVFLCRPLLY